MPDALAHYRVSTAKQGQAALAHGWHLTITAHFTEIESGHKKNRAQLEAALDHARRSKAILLIAKLDRLSPQRRLHQHHHGSGCRLHRR